MFLQEFGDHNNIIKLHNVIKAENDKDIYLVFEFMGKPLRSSYSHVSLMKTWKKIQSTTVHDRESTYKTYISIFNVLLSDIEFISPVRLVLLLPPPPSLLSTHTHIFMSDAQSKYQWKKILSPRTNSIFNNKTIEIFYLLNFLWFFFYLLSCLFIDIQNNIIQIL